MNSRRRVNSTVGCSFHLKVLVSIVSKFKKHRHIAVTAVVIQLLATAIGLLIIHACTGRSPSLARDLSETAYWGTIGVLGMLLIGAPVTLFVIVVAVFLIYCGVRWGKVRFLWVVGLFLWAAWWIFLAYDLCTASAD